MQWSSRRHRPRLPRNMFKIPLFGKQKLRLAFEYGLTLAHTAHEMKAELTSELVEEAEEALVNEFTNETPTFLAVNMGQTVLSMFKLDLSK